MASKELSILIKAKDLASGAIRGVRGQVKGLSGDAKLAAGNAARNVGKIAAGAAVAVAGIAIASGKMAADFQANMANVGTLLGSEGSDRVKALGEDVKRMSVETGKSLEDLTGGLYQVVSAFGDTADTSAILETAAKASTAGLATTEDAVNLLSAVTKGYGDTSAEAVAHASDLAFQTVKLGQTTFPELAGAMGKTIPLAATLGVNVNELFGEFATLTGVTGNTDEVATQLQGTLTGLVKASPALKTQLKGLGYENGQAAIKALGFQGTLLALSGAVGGNVDEMAKLFPNVRGLNAVLALTGPQAQNAADKIGAMGDAAGQTNEAFKIQEATVKGTMDRLKAGASVLMVNIGDALLPAALQVEEKLIGIFSDPKTQDAAKKFGGAIADTLSKAIDFASKLPWGSIASAFELMGKGAKAALDLFLSAPPWLQTAVLTGWGLNKLTGGVLGKVVGGLASGLIKGILGINAGVVNINAGVVNGGGGIGPVASAAAGAGGVSAAAVLGTAAGVAFLATTQTSSGPGRETQGSMLVDALHRGLSVDEALKTSEVTLGAVVDVANNQAVLNSLTEQQRADIRALATQPGISGTALDGLKRQQAHESLAVVRGDAQTRAQLLANKNSVIGEFNKAARRCHPAGRRPEAPDGRCRRRRPRHARQPRQRARLGSQRGQDHRLQGVGPEDHRQYAGHQQHQRIGLEHPRQDHPAAVGHRPRLWADAPMSRVLTVAGTALTSTMKLDAFTVGAQAYNGVIRGLRGHRLR